MGARMPGGHKSEPTRKEGGGKDLCEAVGSQMSL